MEAIQNVQQVSTTHKVVGIQGAGWVIIGCFVIALCIYYFLLGNPANFVNNDPNNHPLPGNFLGTIYKGGIVVPVIQTLLLTVIALSIERYFATKEKDDTCTVYDLKTNKSTIELTDDIGSDPEGKSRNRHCTSADAVRIHL